MLHVVDWQCFDATSLTSTDSTQTVSKFTANPHKMLTFMQDVAQSNCDCMTYTLLDTWCIGYSV